MRVARSQTCFLAGRSRYRAKSDPSDISDLSGWREDIERETNKNVIMRVKDFLLAECRCVRPLMMRGEDGQMEKMTRMDVLLALGWVVALVVFCCWAGGH